MIGAIAGDIVGSVYEHRPIKTKEFPLFQPASRFTDDTVLTVAVAQAILERRPYLETVLALGRRYSGAGFGGHFSRWLFAENPRPYHSWGNGSAMRVSPVGFAFDSPEEVLREAARSAEISHNHPEGIKGAQATALAVFLARTTRDKELIADEIGKRFGYDLDRTVETIRPGYSFDVTCQGTVPEAIIAFRDSDSYEDAIRNAISLGGDSDTLACITGGIAQAFYGNIPALIRTRVRDYLSPELWDIVERFCYTYRLET